MQGETLYDVYKNPSQTKIDIWERIEREIKERNGYSVRVCGSSYTFSVYYYYVDSEDRLHTVKETHVNSIDKIVYRTCNIKAVYNMSAFSAWVILDIIGGYIVSGYVYDGKLTYIRKTKIHYAPIRGAYIIRHKQNLYLDMFMRTNV